MAHMLLQPEFGDRPKHILGVMLTPRRKHSHCLLNNQELKIEMTYTNPQVRLRFTTSGIDAEGTR